MTETRTWEQVRSENDGAAWIDDNGEFCQYYDEDKRPFRNLPKEVQEEQAALPPWQRAVFSGCWSCENAPYCDKYNAFVMSEL